MSIAFGQRGETMAGHNLQDYLKKAVAFGWQALQVADGHNYHSLKLPTIKL